MAERKVVDIPLRGGLDLTSTTAELFQQPGSASLLRNYENGIYGGYRKVNGYEYAGMAMDVCFSIPSDTIIRGMIEYANGLVIVWDGALWWSAISSASTTGFSRFDNNLVLPATCTGASVFVNVDPSNIKLLVYPDPTTDFGKLLIISDQYVWEIVVSDTGGGTYSFTYNTAQVPGVTGTLGGGEIYKERLVTWEGSQLYWSNRYEPAVFTGASAGVVDVRDTIVAVKSFREKLYIFCEDSIHVLENIDGAPTLNPVTRNIGCVHRETVQEVGGDLVFLATDGIRSLGATARIGDIATNVLSSKITPIIDDILEVANSGGYISSFVLRRKNQYRLFFTDPTKDEKLQRGIIGTVSSSEGGGLDFSWSEVEGIEVAAVASSVVKDDNTYVWDGTALANGTDVTWHVDLNGYFYLHDLGDQFWYWDEDTLQLLQYPIPCIYKSPEINFGSSSVRKTLHAMNIGVRPEDSTVLDIGVTFDSGSVDVHNPPVFQTDTIYIPAVIGEFIIGEGILGASDEPYPRALLEGGGYSCKFTISSENAQGPYSIDSLTIEYNSETKYR
ncbi:MAG: hypothetical protein GWO08_19390 [Gammaproteobacteria bacterium]|nr:hypothetical protein [candidate division Zixibacteria bacterium]NIR63438.1 hypothetical protein [candidate division Zixibacteria bacterium]NIR95722.1 hypothetical protein [Gammaproteobacteria bacterium]NIS45390.1 hypothetical protein [candidate division Zixibacteria bacterium]NIU13529.1 hypothetical protein [candidate division Zixibacteria bacterium]